MPNNATLRRQRTLGGALGVIVLGFALTYHFFPQFFHVDPAQAPRRSMSMGTAAPGSPLQPEKPSAFNEINAGPPLTLAPASVIAARNSKNADLPKQLTDDPPKVQELLTRATRALHAGQLAGDENSAAALFAQALKDKPDSRRGREIGRAHV